MAAPYFLREILFGKIIAYYHNCAIIKESPLYATVFQTKEENEMFELILMLLIGLFFDFLGWRIWKREQITLIHEYHYTKVTEKDKKPYTEKIGKACMIMGM